MLGMEVATLPVHRVLGLEPRRLRTHRHCDRSKPFRGAVVEYHADSISSGLTLTLRKDWSCKRGLESRDALSYMDHHQSTGPHGHVSVPLVKVDMGLFFPLGAMTSGSNRLFGQETRTCVQLESQLFPPNATLLKMNTML